MAKEPKLKIHLTNAALDEIATSRGQQIVLRGVIEPRSLEHLKVDDYQREPLPLSALTRLWQALRDGESLPDIELGMRGDQFDCGGKDGEYWLAGDVYIIDGQQRRNAALHILSLMPDLKVRLGAMIHFGTTREWERERFKILNLDRSKVSANVLLRNMRHQSAAVLTLYGLCYNQPDFALFERVCWKQSQGAQELLTARTLTTVSAVLHSHRSPAFRNSLTQLIPALDRQAGFVKLDRWRNNIHTFFELIDECWGLRNVTFRDLSLQVRSGFLTQLALMISDHTNFWRGPYETEFWMDADWRKTLARFPLHDPTVVSLVGSGGGFGGSQTSLLYSLLRDHMNKGRSANRLINRKDEQAANAPRTFSDELPSEDDEELEYPRA